MAKSSQPPPDMATVWGWVIKGFEGCLNMVERCEPFYDQLTPDRRKEWQGLMERLARVDEEMNKEQAKGWKRDEPEVEDLPDTDTYTHQDARE